MIRILCFICLILPQLAWADDSILQQLQTKAGEIQSISSDFIQEKHLSMFDETLVSEGKFAFERPGSLRWEYVAPFKAGFLLMNGTGTEWDEASGTERPFTLQSSPAMSMVASQIMAWTTFDIPWLQSRYEIKQIASSPIVLELRPRSEIAKEFLAHLMVSFATDNCTVSSLELHETDGDFTQIRFKDAQINTPIPETTFTTVR